MSRSTNGSTGPVPLPPPEGGISATLEDGDGVTRLLSIIVPAYGRPERLRVLLGQLLRQDLPPHRYEVIIVDDGSAEPLAPVLEPIVAGSPVSIRCLAKPNGGPASARNHGALFARGEYLLFVDDDL